MIVDDGLYANLGLSDGPGMVEVAEKATEEPVGVNWG